MTQVVIFFGWMTIGIAVTLVVFGHVSIVFVYGFNTLLETLFPKDGISSLIYGSLSLIPGAIILAIGKFMAKLDAREAAREAAENQTPADAKAAENQTPADAKDA